MRFIEINSPGRAVSTLATKLFIDCFLFISQTTEGTDYRAIVSAGRCHFSRRRRPFGRPASVVYEGNERISQLLCRRRAAKEIPFTIGIVYDTHVYISLSHIYLYILYLSILTPAACAGKRHAPARVCTYRSSFKPRCKPRRLPVIS